MSTNSTLMPPAEAYDQSATRFLRTDFTQMPEGVSESLSMGRHTIMISRDPLRPNTHHCVTILKNGLPVATEAPVTEDIGLSLARAIAVIRETVVSDVTQARNEAGFHNLF